MKFYLAGQWQDRDNKIDVTNPGNGEVIDTVPSASETDVETAIQAASAAKGDMARLTGYERFQILRRASELVEQRKEELAETISREEGKTIRESAGEVGRAANTLELSAEEARRISGELLPLDGGPGVQNKLGFTLRIPCGVVAAITPFNFPLNLVCHKVGPAIAAGNSVILKPASDTPLVALKLVEILLQAGLPENGINCLTGRGSVVGNPICRDPRIRKISFTGSREVGHAITEMAGLKRVTMELGSNCPLVVMPDADLEKVAKITAIQGYSNAGQVCISAQRVIVAEETYEAFAECLVPHVESIVSGDPLLETTDMGPMVREQDAERVHQWVQQAAEAGARMPCGGGRDGAFMQPTVLLDTHHGMKVVQDELFGPVVALQRAANIDEAIRLANDTCYGLSAGVFTQDIDAALRFAKEIDSGSVHINWGPMWRDDAMPYGGLHDSGMGKEGPHYAIQEMTESKAVVIHQTV
ncbi:MAG: aldehyde dehydrogenase family protein [Mariniblastus sp.]|nr:aldehyde dehydrogenase family protein [Mariniblastus sp.]